MSDWLKLVGVVLREKRVDSGLSQKKFAPLCGVGEKTLSHIEAGIRSDSMKLIHIDKMARALGTTAAEVIAEAQRCAEECRS